MWPWEHFLVGYVAYSLGKRAIGAPPPGRPELLVLAVGTQFPDLIDKPLGWGTTILPSGVSLAHSYVVAVPLVALAVLLARRTDRPELGAAFGFGYLLHTPADVFARYLLSDEVILSAFVWPLVPVAAMDTQPVFGRAADLFVSFVEILGTPTGLLYLAIEMTLFVSAVLLWWSDRRAHRRRPPATGVAE